MSSVLLFSQVWCSGLQPRVTQVILFDFLGNRHNISIHPVLWTLPVAQDLLPWANHSMCLWGAFSVSLNALRKYKAEYWAWWLKSFPEKNQKTKKTQSKQNPNQTQKFWVWIVVWSRLGKTRGKKTVLHTVLKRFHWSVQSRLFGMHESGKEWKYIKAGLKKA